MQVALAQDISDSTPATRVCYNLGLSFIHVELRLPCATKNLKIWREDSRHRWLFSKAPMPPPIAFITNNQKLIIILIYNINIMTIVVLWL